jgi:transposase
MEAVLERCCGLDVHRDTVVACLLEGPYDQRPEKTIAEFSCMPDGLKRLREWLEQRQCRHVAMESTGVYWQPIYGALEEAFEGEISVMIVNAYHMRNVPGRKTDMKDAEWIAQLLRSGLLSASFIPPKPVREIRELTRYRKTMVEEANAQKNRIEKFLQSTGFKLSTLMTDVFGVSGREILDRLARYGAIASFEVEMLLHGSLLKKKAEIAVATSGKLSVRQRQFLSMLLKHLQQIEANIKEIEQQTEELASQYEQQLCQLDSMPGIDRVAAEAILGEIGMDMSKFKSAAHLCSWAGLSPGNNESAGKKSPSKPQKETPTSKE